MSTSGEEYILLPTAQIKRILGFGIQLETPVST